MDWQDTIAAIATPIGTGGIGVIRISGPRALETADQVFRAADRGKLVKAGSHTVHYGRAVDPGTGEVLDEVLALVMRAPKNLYQRRCGRDPLPWRNGTF